ncbi:MAG: hypothetical protein ABSH47_04020 [Bryobacteraceae bacterium]|jgi:hypothetical protein
MDEEQALRIIDEELDGALAGIVAPPHFAAAIRRRVRAGRVSPLPEILDAIGWAAVLAIVFALLLWLAPMAQSPWWLVGLGSAVVIPALYVGWRWGGELAE